MNSTNERGNTLRLPVGLHLRFLEGLGLRDAATTIRREALKTGQNLCVRAALNKPPDQVAAEYRELFTHGVANSTMVADFLVQLSTLGETAELMSFLDVARLVRRAELLIDDSDRRGTDFWDAIAAGLLKERSEGNYKEAVQSVRKMHCISLGEHTARYIQRLLIEMRDHVSRFLTDLRASGGPAAPWLPQQEFVIRAWAVISTGEGYNVPHIHHTGAISGVLYVGGPNKVGPDGQPLGALRVGADPRVKNAVGWPDFAVAPTPGTLIMMPSYFTHWTVPMGTPGLRISVAFDVVDPRE